jgi:hypothetical protein
MMNVLRLLIIIFYSGSTKLRRKKEEGRGKKEEGRRKKEEAKYPNADYRLPITDYRLPITDYPFPSRHSDKEKKSFVGGLTKPGSYRL